MLNTKSRYVFLFLYTIMMLVLPLGVASAQTTTSTDNLSPVEIMIACICLGVLIAGWGGATFWVYTDANSRNANGMMWGAIVGSLGFMGFCGSVIIPFFGLLCCNIPGIAAIIAYFFMRPKNNDMMGQYQYPPGAPMM